MNCTCSILCLSSTVSVSEVTVTWSDSTSQIVKRNMNTSSAWMGSKIQGKTIGMTNEMKNEMKNWNCSESAGDDICKRKEYK